MPALRASLSIDRTFSPDEYQRLKFGLIPEIMEDKWFIFWEDDWLFFHRSWTGYCMYQLRLELSDGLFQVGEVYANRDPEQYQGSDDDYDCSLLLYLIDRLMLGKQTPFPIPEHLMKDEQKPIYKHHVVGYARSGDEQAENKGS